MCIFAGKMRKHITLLFFLLSLCATAQQYRPEGKAFVCVNGQHRFSRVLYGRYGTWRVFTSDRPLFAVASGGKQRTMRLRVNGVALDETDYCESRYHDGMRSYLLRHKTWGVKASVRLKVVASLTSDQALIRVFTNHFEGAVTLDVTGAENQNVVQHLSQQFEDECFVDCRGDMVSIDPRAGDLFDELEEAVCTLATRLVVSTPDDYINAMGAAVSVASNVKSDVKNVSVVDDLLHHCRYVGDRAYLFKQWPALQRYLHEQDTTDTLVTRLLARQYGGQQLAARIAKVIGENGLPFEQKARQLLTTLNERLWLNDKGHWAEWQDMNGLKRLHTSAALWSIYTPIDYGACTPEQAYAATCYVDEEIPHIPVAMSGLSTLSTSCWMPYAHGQNNVIPAEALHMALAYFQAGRAEQGFRLLKGTVLDQMYCGLSPASLGAYSQYDAAQGGHYDDDADCIRMAERVLTEGLFGLRPDALQGRCIIQPGIPEAWDSASIHTPYISYHYRRQGNEAFYEVTQHFAKPQQIVIRQSLGLGQYRDVTGTAQRHQTIRVRVPVPLPEVRFVDPLATASQSTEWSDEPTFDAKFHMQNIRKSLNANLADLSISGIDIDDAPFRSLVVDDEFVVMGVPFRIPAEGPNIVLTSLDDTYPDSVAIPLGGSAQQAWLLMAGTTSVRESRIENGLVVATYKDGTTDTLRLVNPDNWCPVEQDYYIDDHAFRAAQPRPYRVSLAMGTASRDLGRHYGLQGVRQRHIPGGAATLLRMPLDKRRKLESLTLRALSNDVIIGLMAVTLQ